MSEVERSPALRASSAKLGGELCLMVGLRVLPGESRTEFFALSNISVNLNYLVVVTPE